jgi:hypothetical protein
VPQIRGHFRNRRESLYGRSHKNVLAFERFENDA